jgi:catechol 2,3-dioxygenase-like lactoylglutathione lyase family enzyme
VRNARESEKFYCDLLGLTKDWEHQAAADFPLYVSVSRGSLTLHLSEHDAGSRQGMQVISVEDVDAAYAELCKRGLQPNGPPENRDYGVRDFSFTDPDGHHFVMATPLPGFQEATGRTMSKHRS